MNKKIIFLIAILLIVAVVFVACKGKGDVEETTESTTESATETTADSLLNDFSDDEDSFIIPEVYEEDTTVEGGSILVIGGQEDSKGEDSISWDKIVGNNS